MIKWVALALPFLVALFDARGVWAAWGPAHSALVGTSAIAFAAAGAALFLMITLRRLRRQNAADGAEQLQARGTVSAALGHGGTSVMHWRDGVLAEAYGASSDLNELRASLATDARTRLDDALGALHTAGQPFEITLASADGETAYEATGFAAAKGQAALIVRNDSTGMKARAALEDQAAVLAAEARQLRNTLDAFDLPVWRRGEGVDLSWCNLAYARAVDAEPKAVFENGGIELVHTVPRAEVRALSRTALEANAPQHIQHHVVVNGERRLFDITEAPDPDRVATIGWARDITEVERAERDLQRHTEAHADVLEALNTAIAIYAANTRLVFFNSEFVKLFKLDEDWLHTEPTLGEVLEALREQRRLPEQADWRAFKKRTLELFTRVTEPGEELLHLPDGSTLRHIVTPHPFGGLLFMTQDVTDRFALERDHSTLTAVQRATLDNLYEAVAVFGADGRLKLYNPGYVEMWSLGDAALADEPHVSDIVELGRPLLDDGGNWESYRANEIGRITERTRSAKRIARRDGKVLECGYVPLPDGATLITYLDITDSFQVESALRERTEALETADRLKSEFIANVSYELRTPLNTVIGFTEILANQYFGSLNERQQEYVGGILDSSQHLLALINDILDLATVEAGLMVLEIEQIDVHDVLLSMLGLIQERVRNKQLNIAFECPKEIGRMAADERRVKQVMFNLLSNAVKFTPAGGTVTLGARRSEEAVAVWVADTGVGIDSDQIHIVFDKFAQADSTLARQSGTGLGLSLVKNLVELHGGRVELQSAPDQGTTVTCHFPLGPPRHAITS